MFFPPSQQAKGKCHSTLSTEWGFKDVTCQKVSKTLQAWNTPSLPLHNISLLIIILISWGGAATSTKTTSISQANSFYKKASDELTLARSSSLSVPTSSPGSSSKNGLEGSRGLSALFCYKTNIKFCLFLISLSIMSLSVTKALHANDPLHWFTASYKLFKIKSGFSPCLCRTVRGRLWWNCTSNYNIPLKQIPDWITDCDRHVCVNWTETKGPLSTINIKLGLVVLQKSNNQYLSMLCARLPPPHANMAQNKMCLGAEMPTVALCERDLWPMTCIYTVCVSVLLSLQGRQSRCSLWNVWPGDPRSLWSSG